jgi:hypothetical protein
MPSFKVPEVPATISVSYWNKKRELLSKKKPSGMTEAINKFLAAYKKVDWTPLVEISQAEVSLSGLFGNKGPSIGGEVRKVLSKMDDLVRETKSGNMAQLRQATLNLNTVGKTASAMFKKEKYPKASETAAEIGAEAMFFVGNVNPVSLEQHIKACRADFKAAIDADLKKLIDSYGSLQQAVTSQEGPLKAIVGKKTPAEQVAAYNALLSNGDAFARKITTQLSMRIKAAQPLGCDYPLAKAQQLLNALTPYAQPGQRVPATEKTIKKTLATLAILYNEARKLPNYLGSLPG